MPRIGPDKEQCIRIQRMLGKTYREIAQVCGVSLSTVSRVLRQAAGESAPQPAAQQLAAAAAEPSSSSSSRGGGVSIDARAVEDDVRFMLMLLKNRLDPKHPIMTKMISDVSWWLHLIMDFSKMAIPELMGDVARIDVSNPEATAAELVAVLKRYKELAKKHGELDVRVRQLEEENKMLRRQLEDLKRLYDEAIERTKAMIEDLKRRTGELIVFIVKYAPQSLPEPHRSAYLSTVVPKLKELFG